MQCTIKKPHQLVDLHKHAMMHHTSVIYHTRHICTPSACRLSRIRALPRSHQVFDRSVSSEAVSLPSALAVQPVIFHRGMATQLESASMHVSNTLGVDVSPSKLTEVTLKVKGKARMGISFWPTFSFTPSDSETQYGSVHVMSKAQHEAVAAALAKVAARNAGKGADASDSHSNRTQQQADDRPAAGHAAAAAVNDGSVVSDVQQPGSEHGGADQPSSSGQVLSVVFTENDQPLKEFKVGASFLFGIPFPFISISTTKLEGTIDPETGKVELVFEAKFHSQIGSWVGAALTVDTLLTTEEAEACGRKRKGERLRDGKCTLVAAAKIPSTGNRLADLILWLPTAATAQLPTHLYFK